VGCTLSSSLPSAASSHSSPLLLAGRPTGCLLLPHLPQFLLSGDAASSTRRQSSTAVAQHCFSCRWTRPYPSRFRPCLTKTARVLARRRTRLLRFHHGHRAKSTRHFHGRYVSQLLSPRSPFVRCMMLSVALIRPSCRRRRLPCHFAHSFNHRVARSASCQLDLLPCSTFFVFSSRSRYF
jgi:hypothetical protein